MGKQQTKTAITLAARQSKNTGRSSRTDRRPAAQRPGRPA